MFYRINWEIIRIFITFATTYAKVFSCSSMEMWKFSNLGNYGIRLARIDYVVRLYLWADTPYQSECGVSVVYREKVLPQPP